MKKLFILMLILVSFYSCSEEEIYIPQEVKFTLDYTFSKSGNMTRGTGEDVYNAFYDKYIKTKQLTPSTYSLTFKNKATGAIAEINGRWNSKDGIRLPVGTYTVSGISHRIYEGNLDLHSEYVSDTTFIYFNEEVNISTDQSVLNLTAKYDSYLLMFDAESIESIEYKGLMGWNIKKHDEVATLFINRLTDLSSKDDVINIKRTNGSSVIIHLKNLTFEKGKYYYFNDMTNSFDIPKMESGN